MPVEKLGFAANAIPNQYDPRQPKFWYRAQRRQYLLCGQSFLSLRY